MYQIIKTIFLSILLLVTNSILAQDILDVDYAAINRKVTDENAETYYPKLMKKFNSFDNTLTTEDYMLIYYGFSFQDAYLNNQPEEKSLSELADAKAYKKLIDACEKVLKVNPVSLKANDLMAYALYQNGESEEQWKKYQNRFRAIRKVIAYSGDGQSCENAIKVIYVSDEYNMLYSYFEVEKIHSQKLEGGCDRFEIEPTQYLQSKVIYFDISRKLLRTQEHLNLKKVRTRNVSARFGQS